MRPSRRRPPILQLLDPVQSLVSGSSGVERTVSRRYKIEDIEINSATRELRREELRVAVEPKVFDLLLFLIENRSRVVSKRELIETIWGGRVISEAALSSCIKAARRTLGDDGERQRMIRTVHRCGFHFVGPVAVMDAVEPASGESEVLPSVMASEPCSGSVAADRTDAIRIALPDQPSLAVLPFDVRADDGSWLIAEGIQRDITGQFARARWLFVSARASVAVLAARGLAPDEISARLGVRYLLSGAIAVLNGRIRFSLTLTDGARGCEIWAERIERKIDDIFAVQDEIVDLVSGVVETEIENQERRRALQCPVASLDAWSAYHRALHHLFHFKDADCDKAAEYLDLAVRLDPSAPRVFAALSFLHWQRAFFGDGDARALNTMHAFDYAYQAVALDPLDPQGHWMLGRAHYLTGEVDQGLAESRQAIELNPSFALGQYNVALGQAFAGESVEGLTGLDRARRLSPYDPMAFAFSATRAHMLSFTGDVEAAADWADRAVREPNAHYHISAIAAWCNERANRHERALHHVANLKKMRPDYTREDYYRSFPLNDNDRALADEALQRVGL